MNESRRKGDQSFPKGDQRFPKGVRSIPMVTKVFGRWPNYKEKRKVIREEIYLSGRISLICGGSLGDYIRTTTLGKNINYTGEWF